MMAWRLVAWLLLDLFKLGEFRYYAARCAIGVSHDDGRAMSRFLVIGATGKTGRHVVSELATRGVAIRAASRTPGRSVDRGVEPVLFDWDDETTWGAALNGADGVYLVKPSSEDVTEVVGRFLSAMEAAGTGRLVFLSECGTQSRPDEIAERRVERLVEASALKWTILRPSWYMEDIVDEYFFGPTVRNERRIVMTTGGSAIAWIDGRDIAGVAAELLVSGGSVGQALDLTGPEALTLAQLADRIAEAAGHPVQGVEESILAAERRMRKEGLGEEFIAYMTRIGQSIIAGHTATVTGEVERVTGRRPRSINVFLAERSSELHPSGPEEAGTETEHLSDLALANEAVFRRMISAWSKNDIEALVACFDDNLVYCDMPFPETPVRGKANFREYLTGYNSALFAGGLVDVDIVTLVASNTHVAGELLCRVQYVGPGAPEGGVPVSWYATLVDTIVGGKIVSEHAFFDPTAFDKAVKGAKG